jgi:hypothetical protein
MILNQILRDEIEKKKIQTKYIAIKSLRTKFSLYHEKVVPLSWNSSNYLNVKHALSLIITAPSMVYKVNCMDNDIAIFLLAPGSSNN